MRQMLGIASVAAVVGASLVLAASAGLAADMKAKKDPHARGRYVATIGGCNDCHTPGYAMSGGKVPEKQWLTGDGLGWHGAWGTTYPVNLRLYVQKLDENAWVAKARTLTARPPMPFWALNEMSESDLRALYRFIKGLGPAGEEAPAYLPPGQEPKGPVVTFPAPPQK